MTKQEGGQRLILTYAVLTGLTPLIPVPVADDLAKAYFRRKLVRAVAEARGVTLDADSLKVLAREGGGGCLGGCLVQLLLYPPKKLFRKVFYFLEWKRAVDLTSQTYHFGYLLDYAFSRGLPRELTPPAAEGLRAAVEQVCREAPTRPVEAAVGAAFRQSRSGLSAAAALLERSLRRISGRPGEEQVARAVGEVEEEEQREVAGVVERLRGLVADVPDSHFAGLRSRLDARLP